MDVQIDLYILKPKPTLQGEIKHVISILSEIFTLLKRPEPCGVSNDEIAAVNIFHYRNPLNYSTYNSMISIS